MTLRTDLEAFATRIQSALDVPTSATDAETRGYDNACRDTLGAVRLILATNDPEGQALVQAIHDRKAARV